MAYGKYVNKNWGTRVKIIIYFNYLWGICTDYPTREKVYIFQGFTEIASFKIPPATLIYFNGLGKISAFFGLPPWKGKGYKGNRLIKRNLRVGVREMGSYYRLSNWNIIIYIGYFY